MAEWPGQIDTQKTLVLLPKPWEAVCNSWSMEICQRQRQLGVGGLLAERKKEARERERERCVGGDASTETGTYLVVLYSNLD